MNKTADEAAEWLEAFTSRLMDTLCEVVILPSFPLIPAAKLALSGSLVGYGAQDVSAYDKGAFTGEVSAHQLSGLGCRYVVVGHSERRANWKEGSLLVAAKAQAALAGGLIPILCVGEGLEERKAGVHLEFTLEQLLSSLEGVQLDDPDQLVVAYEPVWAIGTGKTATPEDAQEMAAGIRGTLREQFSELFAQRVRILYGGSVKPSNWSDINKQPDVDGALVGGASLDQDAFLALIKLTD